MTILRLLIKHVSSSKDGAEASAAPLGGLTVLPPAAVWRLGGCAVGGLTVRAAPEDLRELADLAVDREEALLVDREGRSEATPVAEALRSKTCCFAAFSLALALALAAELALADRMMEIFTDCKLLMRAGISSCSCIAVSGGRRAELGTLNRPPPGFKFTAPSFSPRIASTLVGKILQIKN